MTELSLLRGYGGSYLRNALIRPLYDAQKIIGDFIGVRPQEIWPDRYDSDGKPCTRAWRNRRDERLHRAAR